MNEEWNGETKYFAFLLHGFDGEAAGFSFAIRGDTSDFARDAQTGPAGPWPFVFLGAGWTLRDNLGYAARLVLGPDRGVVGISFRVWNNSATAPLVLRRFPAEPLCTIEIRCVDGEQVQRKPKEDPGRWDAKKIVEWVLAPRAKEEIFLPIRDLIRRDFDPKSGKFCQLFIRLSAFPKDTPVGAEGFYPDYQFVPVMVTRTSLAVDPQDALKEATKTAAAAKPR